jgi:hypothetical protein
LLFTHYLFIIKKIILILSLFVITFSVQSQPTVINTGNVSSTFCKISGIVLDSKTLSPLEADVRLFLSEDTVILTGTKCDSAGKFIFDSLLQGSYKIEISFIGYKYYIITGIYVDENSPVKELDTIKLKEQTLTTEEITVEEEKPLLEFQGDKKIFNVEKNVLDKGGTALDILKKVPLIDVDINDNVTLRGSSNVLILINDRPNKFINLKQLPGESIKSVEIITNPPAKYSSEGVTGIINIVLKKDEIIGYNGYFYSSIGLRDKYWSGVNLNLKMKKLSLFSGVYGALYNYNTSDWSSSSYYYKPPVSSYQNGGWTSSKYRYLYPYLAAEYEMTANHIIGAESYLSNSPWHNTNQASSLYLDSMNNFSTLYYTNGVNEGNWKNISASIYYNGKIDTNGREASGNINYSSSMNDYSMELIKQYYGSNLVPLNNTPLNQRDSTNYKSQEFDIQGDYTHPLNKNTSLETGYKGIIRINDNSYNSDTLNYNINGYVQNINVSNQFKLTEDIQAVYGMFSRRIKNFSIRLGLRVEYTHTKGELLSGTESFVKKYTNLFPTINLSQRIGNEQQIMLSYSRRITRPMIYRLNPFKISYDPKFVYMGNPDLNPEFTDSYDLSYLFFLNAFSITPMAFFRQSHDIISSYKYLEDSNVTVTTYRNAAGSKSYGLDFMVNSRSVKWLYLNGTLSIYKTVFDKDVISDYAPEEGVLWRANVRATIMLGKLLTIEIYYNYTGKRINAQGITPVSQNLDISISRKLFDEKATVTLSASDVFNTYTWGQEVYADGYQSTYRANWGSRNVFLNFSYMFGNTKEQYQKKKKVKKNENEGNDVKEDTGK